MIDLANGTQVIEIERYDRPEAVDLGLLHPSVPVWTTARVTTANGQAWTLAAARPRRAPADDWEWMRRLYENHEIASTFFFARPGWSPDADDWSGAHAAWLETPRYQSGFVRVLCTGMLEQYVSIANADTLSVAIASIDMLPHDWVRTLPCRTGGRSGSGSPRPRSRRCVPSS
jgi:hypothetical protein